ncbi:hypothetical protein JCM11251_001271 [Rhodosporidiobolus azoricus]
MESLSAVNPPPAMRLSEEAMDLICSFVREEEDDKVMTKTLRALSLTSFRWSDSAVRALWHDPSRALAWQAEPHDLPNLLFKRPHRSALVRALLRLPVLYQELMIRRDYLLSGVEVENWYLGIIRSCPRLETVAISGNMPYKDPEHCRPLKGIRHILLQPDDGDPWRELYTNLCLTIEPQALPDVRESTIDGFECGLLDGFFPDDPPLYGLPVTHLNLTNLFSCQQHLHSLLVAPHLPSLRHLSIEARYMSFASLDFLPHDSLSFSFRSNFYYTTYNAHRIVNMPVLPHRPNLTSFTFQRLRLKLNDLASLTAAFPALAHIELSDSTWSEQDWQAPHYVAAFRALSSLVKDLPNLHFLSVGYLPLYLRPRGAAFIQFFRLVDERGLDLRYKFPVVPDKEQEEDEGHEVTRSDFEDDSGDREEYVEAHPEPDWSWISFENGRVLFGGFADERTFLEDDFTKLSRPSSPAAFFRLSDKQAYVDEAPVEPKLERDFQVEDEGIEEEKDSDDEPWRRWETEEDVGVADQRWMAFEPFEK